MTEAAQAGGLSSAPIPRKRTPSPLRLLKENAPVPARDFDISTETTDVIYAEDEEVFRETAVRELLKVGFLRTNIHEADNGLGALEHLARMQNEGNMSKPLLVLLDVRMPGMDGRECALQIQELVKKRLLRREPFVVCISSIHRTIEIDEKGGNFQIVLPKPINVQFIDEAFELLRKWWTMGHGRELAAWKQFEPSSIDLIAADDEPVCRLSASIAFVKAGVQQENALEAEDEQELMSALADLQDKDAQRPLIVLLGQEAWASMLRDWVKARSAEHVLRREPFVVCTSVNSDRIGASAAVDNYHAVLPRTCKPKDVEWCLEYCRIWWLTRGNEPYRKVTDADFQGLDSEPEPLSEGSEDGDDDD